MEKKRFIIEIFQFVLYFANCNTLNKGSFGKLSSHLSLVCIAKLFKKNCEASIFDILFIFRLSYKKKSKTQKNIGS